MFSDKLHRCKRSRQKRATRNQALAFFIWAVALMGPVPVARSQNAAPNPAQSQTAPAPDTPVPSPSQNAPAPSGSETGDNAAHKSGTDGIPAIVVDNSQAKGILGTQVRSSAGEDMGRIVDVIVDRQAQARGVVIDFGGFLGVGNRQIAVAWNAIHFSPQDKAQDRPTDKPQEKTQDKTPDKPEFLTVDFTRDQLRAAPAYKSGEQIVLLGQPHNASTNINAITGTGNGSPASEATDKKPPAQ